MFEITLIGTTRLTTTTAGTTTTSVLDVGGVKPRQIVEMLALDHRSAVSKEELAEALWDGKPPSTYAATIESHVSVIRRHLRALGVPADAIRTVHDGYLLTDAVGVDVSDLRATLRDVRVPTPQHLGRVCAVLPAPEVRLLASSPYAAWAIAARESLDVEMARALRRLADLCAHAGDLELATRFLERAQHADPLSELTEQLLMRTLVARGAHIDALVSFARFRRRLREEVGADPGAETAALHLGVLRSLEEHVHELQDQEQDLLTRLLGRLVREGREAAVAVAPAPRAPEVVRLAAPRVGIPGPALVSVPVG